MKRAIIIGFSAVLIFLSSYSCNRRPTSAPVAQLAANEGPMASSSSEIPCTNANVYLRFLRTGNVECRHSLPLEFTDELQRPRLGLLYRMVLDVYLAVPVTKFFKTMLQEKKQVTFPQQTVFVRAQLADDPGNKAPLLAAVKATPTVTYTFKGICNIKVENLDLAIDEINAPDLGALARRIGPVAQNLITLHKGQVLTKIQEQLDAFAGSKYCWYYRYFFHKEDLPAGTVPVEPTPAEKAEAIQVAEGKTPASAAAESEVEKWHENQWDEFNRHWDCGWFGGCR